MATLNKIVLKNFRGAKTQVDLKPSTGQSLLLYGDNGTGKSSFADAIEWLFTGKVAHLRGDGIETQGGIRNSLSEEKDECLVEVGFHQPTGNAKKSLKIEKEKLKIDSDFSDKKIEDLCMQLENDRVILRNSELVSFILASKTDRLFEISNIIGFEQVTQIKAHLKKALGELEKTIKIKGFEAAITKEKNLVTLQLGETIHTGAQFFVACASFISPLSLGVEIKSFADLENVDQLLKAGVDSKALEIVRSFDSIQNNYTRLLSDLASTKEHLNNFWIKREKLISDSERLKNISLSKLLDEAARILTTHIKDECPLCLKLVTRDELKASIQQRISELKELREELEETEKLKQKSSEIITALTAKIDGFCNDTKYLNDTSLSEPLVKFSQHLKDMSKTFNTSNLLEVSAKIDWALSDNLSSCINGIKDLTLQKNVELKASLNSPKVETASKLAVAKTAFLRMLSLQREEDILSNQRDTMEKIVSEFNEKQKIGLDAFLNAISTDMNELFKFMSIDEKVEDVKLTTLVDPKTSEFDGIAVSIKFYGQEVFAPKKYLSESRLNCLGLCLFLSSIKQFNKVAKFIILDDVISSFDKSHRIRFGQLLHEKFSEYQIIVLTHETEWFDFLSAMVKKSGWLVQKTKWIDGVGISIEMPSGSLKEQIEKKIAEGHEVELGNSIRRYGERLLKDVCQELEAPLAFRFNEKNESRTFDELYSGLKGRLSAKSPELTSNEKVNRLSACQFLTNKGSHDNSYNPNLNDMKVGFSDLKEFETLLRCEACSSLLSLRYANVAEKNVSCKCGKLKIGWKY